VGLGAGPPAATGWPPCAIRRRRRDPRGEGRQRGPIESVLLPPGATRDSPEIWVTGHFPDNRSVRSALIWDGKWPQKERGAPLESESHEWFKANRRDEDVRTLRGGRLPDETDIGDRALTIAVSHSSNKILP